MLSIIIQEHNEGQEFVRKMINQVDRLQMEKELIYVTSMHYSEFYRQYGPFRYDFPISVFGNVQSCGQARNVGGRAAAGDTLLYMDSHVCFSQRNVDKLLDTLSRHQDSIVAPAVQAIEFPGCEVSGGIGHGVAFRFTRDNPFEWVWLNSETTDREFQAPFVCGCAFAMKKELFNVLYSYGGFLGQHTGLSWEEEKSMRLWRLGYPTYVEPRAIFGHYYKSYPGHLKWDSHSTEGFYLSRVIGLYINVFNSSLWNYLESLLSRQWGTDWYNSLKYAQDNYSWLRQLMQPYKDNIDEKWFLRTE